MSRSWVLSRRGWLAAPALLALMLLMPALASAQAGTSQWRAALVGANEVPAVTTTATGTFTATLDESAGTLSWTLTVPSITNASAAHLHSGAAGVNGAVVLPLFATGQPAGSINVSGTARQADLQGPFQGNFAGFVSALKAGTIYANVHTSAYPGGEIRAQVVAVQASPTPTGTPAATATPSGATPTPAATATAAPAPPPTGNAGMVARTDASTVTAVLAVLAVAVVLGGRIVVARRRGS